MSQIPTENDDDNRSVAASDFVQFDQPDEDEVTDQQEAQHGQQQFGLHKNPSDWTLNTGRSTSNNCIDLKEQNQKLMMANLEAKNLTLQKALENLELKAENRALKDNAEQKANYQALETKFTKQIEQLESKNRKLEEKLRETTTNGVTEVFEAKMGQLKDEFSKMLSDKIVALRTEIDQTGERAIDSNQLKLDYIWGRLMVKGNGWNGLKTRASISEFGLKATGNGSFQNVFATEGFAISGEQCRKDNFPFSGTIVFYYEVTNTTNYLLVSAGFSDGNEGSHTSANSYAIINGTGDNYDYWLSGKQHKFEHPTKATGSGDVFGAGLLLNTKNGLAAFFTLNGILLGKPTPINPPVNRLYPTVCIRNASVMANFGDNLVAKPFKFDIDKCPGLVFE